MKNARFLFISIGVLALDQVTKSLVRHLMPLYDQIPLLGNLVRFTHVCNQGAGFSFTPGSPLFNRIFFSVISVAAIVVLTMLIHRETRTLPLLSYALIIGGAAGNLVDRIVIGGVTDFIDADFPDFIMERWPVFNVADSSIFLGICLYLVFSLILDRHTKTGDAEHETTT